MQHFGECENYGKRDGFNNGNIKYSPSEIDEKFTVLKDTIYIYIYDLVYESSTPFPLLFGNVTVVATVVVAAVATVTNNIFPTNINVDLMFPTNEISSVGWREQ